MVAPEMPIQEIPHPPTRPLVGNVLDIDIHARAQSMMKLARQYGPIFQIFTPSGRLIVVSGYELVNELCDESRFHKRIGSSLQLIRDSGSPSLFTADTDDPIWKQAHNILVPNFSMRAIRNYHDMMLDIATQLMEKWSRLNFDDEADVPHDMTRLTLDTIGLCGFDYRFNSFYREQPHPFVQAMAFVLQEAMARPSRPTTLNKAMFYKKLEFERAMKCMNDTVDTVIRERMNSSIERNDLLGSMLTQADKQTGQRLSNENIRAQIITFLIAGHETTSGLLSFALYELLKHPAILQRAYEEVDRVYGTDPSILPTYNQVTQLQYISQILKETLRLWPTAPGFTLSCYHDEEILGQRYKVTSADPITVLSLMLHRDKTVWGEHAEEFDPDRFSPEREATIPPNAYKPFGNGVRSCIGRQFALQEATLVLGILLQRFQLIDHTNYTLQIKETLTIKPDHFKIKVKPREGRELHIAGGQTVGTTIPFKTDGHQQARVQEVQRAANIPAHQTPLLILFGSNMGTCEDIARQIANDSELKGFHPTIAPLDDYANKLSTEGATIIVTASYNGQPPDNAVHFCDWLRSGQLNPSALKGVNYTVFGCGNTDWATTYQAIPTLIDTSLEEFGATCIYPRGSGNVKADFDGQFQSWYNGLWFALAGNLSLPEEITQATQTSALYTIEPVTNEKIRSVLRTAGVSPMKVVANQELTQQLVTTSWDRSVHHLEIALPEGAHYIAGDHLGILPHNPKATVRRVLNCFKLNEYSRLRIKLNSNRDTLLPTDEPISTWMLLSLFVELQQIATRKQIATLAGYTQDASEKQHLLSMTGDDEASNQQYRQQVLEPHKALIDLLEEHPSCALPFNIYLEMLPIIRPRFYSISSSPRKQAHQCSITVAQVEGPARAGHGIFQGVSSTFLEEQEPEDNVLAFLQIAPHPLRLPDDPSIPLIMVGPGTGIAPFRGFLQERMVLRQQGTTIGPSLLFFGCRHPHCDFLYEDELKEYEQAGITELYTAFSRVEGQPKYYVQQRIKEQQDKVWQYIQDGAYLYICGDATGMAPAVRQMFLDIYQQKTASTPQQAQQWLDEMTQQGRYQIDIWENAEIAVL